jgi:hypothetical protein
LRWHASNALSKLAWRLAEAKQLTAAIQAVIVPAQVTTAGEHRRICAACGRVLASKGHYSATFRSLFGDVAGPGSAPAHLRLSGGGRSKERRRLPP